MADDRHITIGPRTVGAGQPCFIIAEAGINHNGDVGIIRSPVRAIALLDNYAEVLIWTSHGETMSGPRE